MNKKIILIIIGVIIIGIIITVIWFFIQAGKSVTLQNKNQTTENANQTNNLNEDTNLSNNNEDTNQTGISTNEELTTEGMVFVKGYKTPSESYGISTTDNHEIGLGKYDSMKEQFRPYVGEKIKVTFSRVCRSTGATCCRTIFYYCGTVKSWEPINTNK